MMHTRGQFQPSAASPPTTPPARSGAEAWHALFTAGTAIKCRRPHPSAPLFGAPQFETPVVPACDRPAILDALAARCPSVRSVRTWRRLARRPSSEWARMMARLDVRRRGARGRRRSARQAVRRPRRPVADRHDHQGNGPDPRSSLHRERAQVPSSREPYPHARRNQPIASAIWNSRSPSSGPSSSACSAGPPRRRCWNTTLPWACSEASGTATAESPPSSPITRPTCSEPRRPRKMPGKTCKSS